MYFLCNKNKTGFKVNFMNLFFSLVIHDRVLIPRISNEIHERYIHAHVQLLESLLEERNNFLGQFFSHSESLRVQHDFSNELSVRFGHG